MYVCINIGIGGMGGNSLNPIQASENIVILETNDCTSSVVQNEFQILVGASSLPLSRNSINTKEGLRCKCYVSSLCCMEGVPDCPTESKSGTPALLAAAQPSP